jgi:hypothetical protein
VSGYHGRNDDAISREVAESLEPIGTVVRKRVPFEECGVKGVCIVDKLLEIFKCNLGSERRTPQVLQEAIETVGPETNDDVVFLGNLAQ